MMELWGFLLSKMPTLRQIRLWLLAVAGGFALLDLLATGLLLSPAGRSVSLRMAEHDRLRAEVVALKASNHRELLDASRLQQARRQVDDFYAQRFPEKYSSLSAALHEMASAHNVRLSSVKYATGEGGHQKLSPEEAKRRASTGLEPVGLDLTVEGGYRSQVEFLNALERSPMLFIVRGVAIGGGKGKQQGSTGTGFTLRLESYLRSQKP